MIVLTDVLFCFVLILLALMALDMAYDALFEEVETQSQHDFIYRDWADRRDYDTRRYRRR
jgi:hypothetical protein